MYKKTEAGAGFFYTSVVYDVDRARTSSQGGGSLEMPMLIGLRVLKDLKGAKRERPRFWNEGA